MEANHCAPPDLSVIILTHNTSSLTHACVRSVLADAASSGRDVEIIVVDNASTDNTVSCLSSEFPGIKIIENPINLGFSRGNNIGLASARGRYLMLLNSDTLVHGGMSKTLIDFMDIHADAGACGPTLLNTDGSLQPSGRSLPSLWGMLLEMSGLYRLWRRDLYAEPGRDYSKVARVGELSGAALLVRRAVYDRIGGLDENLFAFYEDIDWCKRMGDTGKAIYYVPMAQVTHHWRGTSSSLFEAAYRAGQDGPRYYFRKHQGKPAQLLVQTMLAAKEAAFIVIYAFRGDSDARRFHQRMCAHVFAPLPSGEDA